MEAYTKLGTLELLSEQSRARGNKHGCKARFSRPWLYTQVHASNPLSTQMGGDWDKN